MFDKREKEMNEADRIDGLKALSQTHREQSRERRKTEWRCVFTTISFFVLSGVAVLKNQIHLNGPLKFAFSVVFAALAIITAIFLAYLHMAGNKDKELAERAEDMLRSILDPSQYQKTLPLLGFEKYWVSWQTFRRAKGGRWGYIWQTITICFFAVGSGIIIWIKV